MSDKKILKRLIKRKKIKKFFFKRIVTFFYFLLNSCTFLFSKHNMSSNTQHPATPQYEIKSQFRVSQFVHFVQSPVKQWQTERFKFKTQTLYLISCNEKPPRSMRSSWVLLGLASISLWSSAITHSFITQFFFAFLSFSHFQFNFVYDV